MRGKALSLRLMMTTDKAMQLTGLGRSAGRERMLASSPGPEEEDVGLWQELQCQKGEV